MESRDFEGETKKMNERVKIFDTTLRDGEQSPGATMNVAEKVRIAQQLEKLNVDIIEAGFPISSEGDFEAVKAISRTIKRSEVAALARANPQDIDRAWEAVKGAKFPRLHTFISTSDIHLKHQLKKSKEEVIQDCCPVRGEGKALYAQCRILGHGCDPERCRISLRRHRSSHPGRGNHHQHS